MNYMLIISSRRGMQWAPRLLLGNMITDWNAKIKNTIYQLLISAQNCQCILPAPPAGITSTSWIEDLTVFSTLPACDLDTTILVTFPFFLPFSNHCITFGDSPWSTYPHTETVTKHLKCNQMHWNQYNQFLNPFLLVILSLWVLDYQYLIYTALGGGTTRQHTWHCVDHYIR